MINRFFSYIKEQDSKFIFLILLLIFLPSFEAPKNLFALLFVILWVFISKREKNWGGRWRLIDTILLLWIIAGIIIGINGIITHDMPANGSKDIIKFVLVGWAVSRSRLNTKQIIILCMTAIIFSVIPLGYSYLDCPGGVCVELNSVGHVNHTAIYLLIAYVLSLSLLVLNYKNINNTLRLVLTITTIILAYVVIDTHSRSASSVLILFTLMLMLYAIYHYKNWYISIIAILLLVFASTILIYSPPSILYKKFQVGTSLLGDSPRQKIRNFSYYAFKSNPILGIGFGNFVHLGHDDIKSEVVKVEGVYNQNKFSPASHPHNIYYTYLVSGGLVIFSIFIWFWLHIAQMIYRVNKQSNEQWLTFSSMGVVMTVLGIGWVNTTLSHENALISMFILGLLISKYREFV